ncbi:MAG: hypothetical protein CMJ64_28025 [Planctomycetaceae bacterium]|nr:hypothetical protein [Planctomycetaceae bacterium]
MKVVPNSPQAKAAIEAAIRKTAGKPTGELTKADLEKMTGRDVLLDIRSKNITDLTPLADLTNLVQFQLGRNQITDLTPLTGLTKLEGFVVGRNPITDLTPLAGSTKLEWLRIAGNPNLTQAEIDKLQKALPKCKITHPF